MPKSALSFMPANENNGYTIILAGKSACSQLHLKQQNLKQSLLLPNQLYSYVPLINYVQGLLLQRALLSSQINQHQPIKSTYWQIYNPQSFTMLTLFSCTIKMNDGSQPDQITPTTRLSYLLPLYYLKVNVDWPTWAWHTHKAERCDTKYELKYM